MPTEQTTRKSAKDIVKEYLDRRAAAKKFETESL